MAKLGTLGELSLRPAEQADVSSLMTWFTSQSELEIWAGPGITYPFDEQSFAKGLKLTSLKSYVLTDSHGAFLGFGQYYLRLNRCHLGRLVINPSFRGKGLSQQLVQQLIKQGTTDLKTPTVSLFVLDHNEVAINSYKKLGFKFETYPETVPLDNCSYMVKSI